MVVRLLPILLLPLLLPAESFRLPNARGLLTQTKVRPACRGGSIIVCEPPRVGPPSDEERERNSLYTTPSFEFDAVTITALLGAAIAFQFFILGNM